MIRSKINRFQQFFSSNSTITCSKEVIISNKPNVSTKWNAQGSWKLDNFHRRHVCIIPYKYSLHGSFTSYCLFLTCKYSKELIGSVYTCKRDKYLIWFDLIWFHETLPSRGAGQSTWLGLSIFINFCFSTT